MPKYRVSHKKATSLTEVQFANIIFYIKVIVLYPDSSAVYVQTSFIETVKVNKQSCIYLYKVIQLSSNALTLWVGVQRESHDFNTSTPFRFSKIQYFKYERLEGYTTKSFSILLNYVNQFGVFF